MQQFDPESQLTRIDRVDGDPAFMATELGDNDWISPRSANNLVFHQ